MDDALRELERRYRASGAVGDGVAWLSARLRAGDVTRDDLEVAAICGERAALALAVTFERELVSTNDVARLVARPDPIVRRWAKEGCPVTRERRELRFDPLAVLGWLGGRGWDDVLDPAAGPLHLLRQRHPRAAARVQDSTESHPGALARARAALWPPARAALIAWALEPGARTPRLEVRAREGEALIDDEERWHDVHHEVLDRRTGRVHGAWTGRLTQRRDHLGWGVPGRSGVARVELASDALVVVHHHDGRVEQVALLS